MITMKLKEIAHARTGDKGEISNISVIPYREADFEWLRDVLTAEKVKAYFGEICRGEARRYELPGIRAFNFVLDKTLGGGVTRSLSLDKHGKTLGMALLEMEVDVPAGWTRFEGPAEGAPGDAALLREALRGRRVRIGSGAGYAGDRLEPALELLEKGNLDYLIFECLAERTVALGQKEKEKDAKKGYNPLLEYRMRRALPLAFDRHVRIVTNMGAANPRAAAEKVRALAAELGLEGMKVACVTGDDITDRLERYGDSRVLENGKRLRELKDTLLSANVYMGAEGIVQALAAGADVVITGRVSDPALTIGPLVYEFGWDVGRNPEQMGQAVLAGHLLECAGQVTGGYYADPGYKDVPDLDRLGFPIVEMAENGAFTVSKPEGSGGLVSVDTCKEQTIYEIHDPKAYLTPDAVADFSGVYYRQAGENRVLARGAVSHGRPKDLKVSVGCKDCWIGEGEISYGGSGCLARAKLAADILKKRIAATGIRLSEYRTELIGWDSLYRDGISQSLRGEEPCEVRLRAAGRTADRWQAELLADEVEALYTNGPAGGGGAVKRVSEIVSVCSVFVPRDSVHPETELLPVPNGKGLSAPPTHRAGCPRTVMVPADDGVRLETVVRLPEGEGPWPILLKRCCYPQMREYLEREARLFAARGFGYVYQWCRGTAGSEGTWEPNVNERADGLAAVRWLAAQPYTKNIGFWGDSYLALTGWCMLDAVPKAVKSMYLGVYGVDRHTSAYQDGLFRQDVLTSWAMQNTGTRLPKGVSLDASYRFRPQTEVDERLWGTHLSWYRDWIKNPDRDGAYWQEGFWGMLKRIPGKAKIPVCIREGWYDHHLGSALISYDALNPEIKEHCVLQIGPWNHGYQPVIPFAPTENLADDAQEAAYRWFRETLIEEKLPEGKILEYVIGEDAWMEKKERGEEKESRTFYFGDGTLTGAPGADGSRGFVYDPDDPVPSHGTESMLANMQEQGSLAQPGPDWRPDVLSFVSAPLPEGFTADGAMEVTLYAATDAEDTAFTAKVMEVLPDGTAVNVRGSITTMAYRGHAYHRLPYTPGETVRLTVTMWDIAWKFRAGSRIRVDVSSSDFPQYAVHSNRAGVWSEQEETQKACQTVRFGKDYPSAVRFPVRFS